MPEEINEKKDPQEKTEELIRIEQINLDGYAKYNVTDTDGKLLTLVQRPVKIKQGREIYKILDGKFPDLNSFSLDKIRRFAGAVVDDLPALAAVVLSVEGQAHDREAVANIIDECMDFQDLHRVVTDFFGFKRNGFAIDYLKRTDLVRSITIFLTSIFKELLTESPSGSPEETPQSESGSSETSS